MNLAIAISRYLIERDYHSSNRLLAKPSWYHGLNGCQVGFWRMAKEFSMHMVMHKDGGKLGNERTFHRKGWDGNDFQNGMG